jgi:diadenosine tetraphosphatase ApaH/serine/threonine PP2A family protein phosphatase
MPVGSAVDTDALLKTVWAALAAGIGIALSCSFTVLGMIRAQGGTRERRCAAHGRLGSRWPAFMRELPLYLRFELGGKRVRLVHGSPRKVNEYLFEDKPARTFGRIAAGADCDVLVFGHTHQPWGHEYGGVLFVNCGSVGKPKDGRPRRGFRGPSGN